LAKVFILLDGKFHGKLWKNIDNRESFFDEKATKSRVTGRI